jgi:histidinol-phosphate aminotransferase
MLVSRRNFLRTVGIGAAAGATVPWGLGRPVPGVFEPMRPSAPDGFIRLDNNENAYGVCTKASAMINSTLSEVNRYPDADYEELTDRIARFHGTRPPHVLLGCGSTEILRVAAMAFLGVGKQLVQSSPTFEAMEHYTRSIGGDVLPVPLDSKFAHDLGSMRERISSSTTLVYICNPNNPTGSITPRKGLETFIRSLPGNCHVLIDEAYHHYAGESSTYASFIDDPIADERIIVCRSFSKVHGLAGLRLGYCIAAPSSIENMRSYLTFGSVNSIAVRAAAASLEDRESVRDFVRRNRDERQEFFNQATARVLKPIDSHTNFVMMNTYHSSEGVIEHFRNENILIGRRFPTMNTYIRVSLGLPEEMQAFWKAWDRLPFAKDRMHH